MTPKNPDDEKFRELHKALTGIFIRPSLINQLKSEDTKQTAMEQLNISSEEMRLKILTLLNYLEGKFQLKDSNQKKEDKISGAQLFFDKSEKQLQKAYRTSSIMSTTMFIVGVAFLALAGFQAIIYPENVATTSVVGGIGIIQIVALFYRRPLSDIATSVSNAQQSKIAITSYLIGLEIIHKNIGKEGVRPEHLQSLLQLTEKTISQLESYTKGKKQQNQQT